MYVKCYKYTLLRFRNYTGVNFFTTRPSLLHFCVQSFYGQNLHLSFLNVKCKKAGFNNLNNHSLIQSSDFEESIVLVTVVAVSNHTNGEIEESRREDMDYDQTVN